jgi:hypothetical protein
MTVTTNRDRDARTELHATAGAVVAQLRDKLRAVEACEKLLGAHALETKEARALFDRVRKADAHDTEELQALLGKLHVSGRGPAPSAVTRAAATEAHDDVAGVPASTSSDEETERLPQHARNAASRSKE